MSVDKAIKNTEKIKEWQDHMIPIDYLETKLGTSIKTGLSEPEA